MAEAVHPRSGISTCKRKGVNLLAGRLIFFYLTPFMWNETGVTVNPKIIAQPRLKKVKDLKVPFEEQLVFGSLPAVIFEKEDYKAQVLKAYVQVYLEEEIRQEAIVRKIGSFGKFLQLAALESGSAPNLTQLSLQSGVSVPSIREFFQVLEDTLIIKRLDPYIKSPRKRLFSTPSTTSLILE